MIRFLTYLLLILLVIFSGELQACTVFYFTDGISFYGGNNEDWKDPATKMWFYSASEAIAINLGRIFNFCHFLKVFQNFIYYLKTLTFM